MIVRLLGPWIAIWLHWSPPSKGLPRGRSVPCMGEECVFPHQTQPPFWYAYAPCQRFHQGFIAEAQHVPGTNNGELWNHLREQMKSKREAGKAVTWWAKAVCPISEEMVRSVIKTDDVRGIVLELSRVQGRRELTVKLLERCSTVDLPEAFDVRPVLMKIWRMRGLKGGA